METLLVSISRNVSKELGNVKLNDDDNLILIKCVKKVNFDRFKNCDMNKVILALSSIIADEIKSQPQQSKEAMSSAVNKNSNVEIKDLFGISDIYQLQKFTNPSSLYTHNYIVLDTKNRTTYTNGINKFNWELMENATLATGVVNTNPIKNLVGIRIYPLKFTSYRGFPNNKKFTILIDELASQSFIAGDGRRFHFILESSITDFSSDINYQYIEMTPRKSNKGYFWFDPPITTVKSFTISMADIFNIVNLPTAIQDAAFYFTNPMQIAPFYLGEYNTGDIIFITGFNLKNPTNPTNAAFINAVNSTTGYPITVIGSPPGFLGFSIFTIPLDATVISTSDIPYYGTQFYSTNVYYALGTTRNNSIGTAIPLELISLKDSSNENV